MSMETSKEDRQEKQSTIGAGYLVDISETADQVGSRMSNQLNEASMDPSQDGRLRPHMILVYKATGEE